jgi:hypothetical protein
MFTRLTMVVVFLLVGLIATDTRGQCVPGTLKSASVFEKNSLVIDVRPDQINQFKGKSAFKDNARIVLVKMNPFLFSYSLKVDQTEIHDTGFLNFLKLLGSPVTDLIGSVEAFSATKALGVAGAGSFDLLKLRTDNNPANPHPSCPAAHAPNASQALAELHSVRDATILKKNTVDASVAASDGNYAPARASFEAHKDTIFNASVEEIPLCNAATTLYGQLAGAAAFPSVETMQGVLKDVGDFKSMVEELKNSAQEYKTEYPACPARANGLNYADNLVRLANELAKLADAYEKKVNAMIAESKSYDALVKTIAKLKNEDLQKEYTVFRQFDISALDITATAVPLGEDAGFPRKDSNQTERNAQLAPAGSSTTTRNARLIDTGATESSQGVRVFTPHKASFTASAEKPANEVADLETVSDPGTGTQNGTKQIKTTGTIGARRFELSAGMTFSSLDRREFQPVLGYPRNAQGEIIDPATGNPTTDRKFTTVVGLSEQSSSRFAPLAMLHYRLPLSNNIFASAGFTGKQDAYGVDLEYLLGPSVLYKNMFFTFGGYAGKQQKLAGDLFEGAFVDDDIPVRKDYKWGWGFSFTYRLPLGSKKPDK